jgi:alpha-N-arabinofuranosidase
LEILFFYQYAIIVPTFIQNKTISANLAKFLDIILVYFDFTIIFRKFVCVIIKKIQNPFNNNTIDRLMKNLRLALIAIASTCLASTAGIHQHYNNPIIPGYHPDPSICRVNDDYYLVNSSFHYFPGVPIYHSTDLVNWELIGHCLSRSEQVDLSGANFGSGIFAPTIRYNNGTFYMITTNVSHDGNFIVYTDNPANEWSNPIKVEQGGIDPSLFFENGKCYMVSNPDGYLTLCEINPLTGETLSPSRKLWTGTGGRYPEGPHIYKKDGYYYLLISEGGTEYAHNITIARSRDIYGPYESNPANPILTHCNQIGQNNQIQGTGHADLVQAPDGSWWMVCLAFRTQSGNHHLLGRETFLTPVRWDDDAWPVVNGNGTIQLEMCADLPNQISQQTSLSFKQNISAKHHLDNNWVYLRKKVDENYKYTDNSIRLYGTQESLNSPEYPTFIGRPLQNINFSATTNLRLNGNNTGDKAGLSLFMDANSHYDISIRQNLNGKNEVVVEYWLGELHHIECAIELSSNKCALRVSGNEGYYTFYYSENNRDYRQLAKMDVKYLSSETAGGFTGIMIGLFAESTKASSKSFGEFYSFEYEQE